MLKARRYSRPVYTRERLFDPLGINTQPAAEPVAVIENLPVYEAASFAWPVDPQGHHRGDTFLKISAPDMAKLGRLMLTGGRWDGKQIVSTRWVTEHTSLTPETRRNFSTTAREPSSSCSAMLRVPTGVAAIGCANSGLGQPLSDATNRGAALTLVGAGRRPSILNRSIAPAIREGVRCAALSDGERPDRGYAAGRGCPGA